MRENERSGSFVDAVLHLVHGLSERNHFRAPLRETTSVDATAGVVPKDPRPTEEKPLSAFICVHLRFQFDPRSSAVSI